MRFEVGVRGRSKIKKQREISPKMAHRGSLKLAVRRTFSILFIKINLRSIFLRGYKHQRPLENEKGVQSRGGGRGGGRSQEIRMDDGENDAPAKV